MNYRNLYLSIRPLLAGLLILPIIAGAGIPLDNIVAVVNEDVIMRSELDAEIRSITERFREQGAELPPPEVLEKQVLDNLILVKLQLQTAQRTGIRVDDETLNRMISNIAADSKITLKELREILEKDNINYEEYRNDLRNEIQISRLRQRQVDNRVTVSAKEIDTYLENQVQQGEGDREYRISHILFAIPETASAGQRILIRKQADEALARIRNGEDFANVASSSSDSEQALQGGDLGWRKTGEIPTLFSDLILNMAEGDVSEVLTSSSGYHIVKLTGVRDSETLVVTQNHARHILLKTDEVNTEDDIKVRMDQLYIRLTGGDDFTELAKGHSMDPSSAAKGGDLGWMNPGDVVPEFEQVMNSLDINEISKPFPSQYGWHIVQVLERRSHDNTEEQKRNKARDAIRQRKLDEARESWLRQMRDEAYVEYRLGK
ncbi:MAG: molecular chaperone SurA [Gammaproteobacteria bacterium]|nr:MAG: molecular chaperone SurA [Gammaproteobacteria bacterium]